MDALYQFMLLLCSLESSIREICRSSHSSPCSCLIYCFVAPSHASVDSGAPYPTGTVSRETDDAETARMSLAQQKRRYGVRKNVNFCNRRRRPTIGHRK